jgi:cell division protein ZapA
MKEFTISVNIADRPYRLTIKREEEEVIRKAANKINDKVKNYSANYAFNDKQDLLAMVALEEATVALNNEHKLSDIDNSVVKDLTEIDSLLAENLKTK